MFSMNRVITLLLLIGITISASFFGCKRSVTSNNTYSMKAKIGSTDVYTAPNCLAVINASSMVIEGLAGSAPFPSYPYIELVIPNWYGSQGPYPVDSLLGHPHIRYYIDADHTKISWYGSIIINSVSTEIITGTFTCTTQDTTLISEGAFTAKVFK